MIDADCGLGEFSPGNALLRYVPWSGLFTGRLTYEVGHLGASVGDELGGAKIVGCSPGRLYLEIKDPTYDDFLNFGQWLGGLDSVKALTGMACQAKGKEVLVSMLNIK